MNFSSTSISPYVQPMCAIKDDPALLTSSHSFALQRGSVLQNDVCELSARPQLANTTQTEVKHNATETNRATSQGYTLSDFVIQPLKSGTSLAASVALVNALTTSAVNEREAVTRAQTLKQLGGAQVVSKAARMAADQLTESVPVRAIAHSVIQAGRNAYMSPTPLSIGLGVLDGAGYCLTGEAKQKLNESGHPLLAGLVGSLGTVVTELAQGVVKCLVDGQKPTCKYLKHSALAATVILLM